MAQIRLLTSADGVMTEAQTLTAEQQAQARENIGIPNPVTVDTYADLLLITPNTVRTDVFVISDEKNNNGQSSEYRIYPNGTIMWQASININQL